ncbi:MAG: hypothetical protein ACPG4X_12415 [Pikeienuella sp.]
MRTRLILHIGMHKTGSSAIQRFLSRNRWVLGKLGIAYPHSLGPTGQRQPKHNAIFAAISHQADKGRPHPDLGPAATLIEATAAEIERAAPRTAILSAEGFSGERPIFARALRPLANRFDVRVVVFLRRRDLWVESFYKQMVQSHDVAETRPFHDFLQADSTRRHMDYLTILNWWAEAFGQDAIIVTPFEASAGEPVHLFLAAAGLSPRLAYLPFSRGAVNVSCSAETTEILRLANKDGRHATKAETARIEGTIAPRQGAFLTKVERAEINAPFVDDDAEIMRRFTPRNRDRLFADISGHSRSEKWAGFAPNDPRRALINHVASG